MFGKGGAFEASVEAILVGVGLKVGTAVGVGVGVGKGIGVAVIVEKTGVAVDLKKARCKFAAVRVLRARVRFLPRDFAFSNYDRNRDGRLDRDEAPSFLAADFAELDRDGDGFLEPSDLDD